jgi:hypothetical protein
MRGSQERPQSGRKGLESEGWSSSWPVLRLNWAGHLEFWKSSLWETSIMWFPYCLKTGKPSAGWGQKGPRELCQGTMPS